MKHIFATKCIPFNSPFAHCAAHTIFPMKYPWAKGESKEWSLPWRGAASSLLPKANFSRANAKGNVATQQQQVLDHKIGLLLLVYRVLSLQSDYCSLQQCKTIIHLQPFSPFSCLLLAQFFPSNCLLRKPKNIQIPGLPLLSESGLLLTSTQKKRGKAL